MISASNEINVDGDSLVNVNCTVHSVLQKVGVMFNGQQTNYRELVQQV